MFLKEYLEKNNLSYRKFADKAGVHYSSISYFLSGRNKSISLDLAQKISKATDDQVTFNDLLEEAKTVKVQQ